jgi:hypothetical protein
MAATPEAASEWLEIQSRAKSTQVIRGAQVAVRYEGSSRWESVHRFDTLVLEPGQSIRIQTGGRPKGDIMSMRRPLPIYGNAEAVALLDPRGVVVDQRILTHVPTNAP